MICSPAGLPQFGVSLALLDICLQNVTLWFGFQCLRELQRRQQFACRGAGNNCAARKMYASYRFSGAHELHPTRGVTTAQGAVSL